MGEKVAKIEDVSPMMKQYLQIKEQYKDCVLFYRLGDFYELFYDDAVEISKVLDLTLTGKNCGQQERAPMCGVPYHAADGYIAKLVAKGYKVAICEQLEEPTKGKTVARDVVRVVTAGTVTEDSMLQENKNNFIMSVFVDGDKLSVAYCDITTGELDLCHYDSEIDTNFSNLLGRVSPAQVIGNSKAKAFYCDLPVMNLGIYPKFEEYLDFAFSFDRAKDAVEKQFGTNAVRVFELSSNKQDIPSIGGLLQYLFDTQKKSLQNILKINKINEKEFMVIDASTRRNLELVENIRERKRYGSLLWLMDKTKTSMGARRFRSMFDEPLQNATEINNRLDAVEELTKNLILRDRLGDVLANVCDIERICGKIAYANASPGDLVNLKNSLAEIPNLVELLGSVKSRKLVFIKENLTTFDEIVELLEKAVVVPSVEGQSKEGKFLKNGFNEELDQLRNAKEIAVLQYQKLEEAERERTGIKNLKIKDNNVFGLFIEVPNGQKSLVPLSYTRKQTLANAERYTTPELKAIEDKLFGSDEEAVRLEEKLWKMLLEFLCQHIAKFSDVAKLVAELDALLSLAVVAVKQNFCKPVINRNVKVIDIKEGRHPIVEKFAKDGNFIANDTYLDTQDNQMMIITGPNMAGKSTYMRQVAIITFLAHIGSFVPAKSATISLTDRIFTRVGASDDLAFGQSTFMVEMSEVANILQNATDKSLVVLDEIGRGTSTFDGLSIAWAVVEFIVKKLSCKTLFATHYHELSELEGVTSGVKNYKITVKEVADSVVFLRKIVRGAANKSFGVEVASLAGVPQEVIERAKEISVNLESVNHKLDMNLFGEDEERRRVEKNNKKGQQILSILRDLDLNRMTPMETFEVLNDLVERAKKE